MKFKVVPPRMTMAIVGEVRQEVSLISSLKTWHERLAHQNFRHVKEILRTWGIKTVGAEEFCKPCVEGKSHRLPHPVFRTGTTRVCEIVHADVCGKVDIKSLGRAEYFLLIKDDYSHYREVYFMKTKDEVSRHLQYFFYENGKRNKQKGKHTAY